VANNIENLKTPSAEEARTRGRKGGIQSGKARREKKAMRETLAALLSMPMKDGEFADAESIKNFASMKGKNIDVQTAISIAMIQRALKGDKGAAEFVRDTSGQKPTDNMNITGAVPVVIKDDVSE
jgi:hypothetical protein